jgi:hypothetical protein
MVKEGIVRARTTRIQFGLQARRVLGLSGHTLGIRQMLERLQCYSGECNSPRIKDFMAE